MYVVDVAHQPLYSGLIPRLFEVGGEHPGNEIMSTTVWAYVIQSDCSFPHTALHCIPPYAGLLSTRACQPSTTAWCRRPDSCFRQDRNPITYSNQLPTAPSDTLPLLPPPPHKRVCRRPFPLHLLSASWRRSWGWTVRWKVEKMEWNCHTLVRGHFCSFWSVSALYSKGSI